MIATDWQLIKITNTHKSFDVSCNQLLRSFHLFPGKPEHAVMTSDEVFDAGFFQAGFLHVQRHSAMR